LSCFYFKFNNVGDSFYHRGGDFSRDATGTLEWGADSYVEKGIATDDSEHNENENKSKKKDIQDSMSAPSRLDDATQNYQL
jgi:flagellar hook protein FlgE